MGNINDTYFVTTIYESRERIEEIIKELHIPILFYDEPNCYYDQLGQFHSIDIIPNGKE